MAGGTKRCLGCNDLGRWDSTGRCAPCQAVHKSKYDADYYAARHAAERRMQAGAAFDCPRCGEPIDPTSWDLGHQPDGTLAPEHPRCNRGARRSKRWAIAP